MKRFPAVLNDILQESQLTQAEIGNLSSLGQLKISRLVNGVIRADKEDFAALYSPNVGLDHHQKARLAMAHIEDELPADAFQHLAVTIPEMRMDDSPTKGMAHLSGRAQSALRYLLSLQDELPNLGDLLIEQAKLVGWKEQSTPGLRKDTVRKVVEILSPKKTTRYPAPRRHQP